MLQEISLSNFRVFDETAKLRVRPITILIGRNSAGKSTLIKFLLMLQQSLRAPSAEFLVSEGDRVHLGAFSDLKNSKTKKLSLEYELLYTTRDLPSPAEREMMKSMQDAIPQIDPKTKGGEFRFVVNQQRFQSVVKQESAAARVSGSVSYRRAGQRGFHEVVVSSSDVVLHKNTAKNLGTSSFLRFPVRAKDPREAMGQVLADRYVAPIRYELHSMRHLSAIREESQRAIIASSPPPDDVGQRGQYAMPHLQEVLAKGGDDAAFVIKHIEAVAEIESVKFQSSMKGYLAHCRAVNKQTGAEAYLADFGFGVSQCIPIFVQGAIMPKNNLLLVEQPEAQLHPTAQLEMGSFFADLWKQRHVPSIIETHSSNIIMRMRRLVANGTLSPSDVSIAYLCVKKKMPIIRNLDIDGEGNLEKGLPMEFFGADVLDSIKLGAGR